MRKLLNNPWVVTALSLVAIAFVVSSLRSKPAEPTFAVQAVETTEEPQSDAAPVAETAPMSVAEALAQLASLTTPRDPFAGPVKVTDESAASESTVVSDIVDTVKLSAIWTQGGQTYVLINGRIHQAGDEISRIKILSADQKGVWVGHWKGRDFMAVGSAFTLVTPGQKELTVAKL
jgi:hypothetical protein